MTTLQISLAVVCAAVAVALLLDIARDRPVGNLGFAGLVLIEAGLVVQAVWGVVDLIRGEGEISTAPYLGYLIGALLILPIGFVWSASEKSRSGTAVLLVAVLVLPVLFVRLHDLRHGLG